MQFPGSWAAGIKGSYCGQGKHSRAAKLCRSPSCAPKSRNKEQTHSIYSSSLLPRFHWRPWKAEHKPQQAQENLSSHARAAAPFPALRRLNAASRRWEGNGEKVAGGQKAAAKERAIRMQELPEIWHHQRFTVRTHLPPCSQCTRSFFLSIYIQ